MHDMHDIAGNRTQVVLVDDNDLDNEYHQIVLRKLDPGLPVQVFESGRGFLDFLQATGRPVDCLVFLDINMPGMSGFEVLEQIGREGIDLTGVRIYILSSSDSPADRARAAGHTALQGYFTKPLTAAMLAESIGRS